MDKQIDGQMDGTELICPINSSKFGAPKKMGPVIFMLFPYIQFQDLQIFCSQDFPIATMCVRKRGHKSVKYFRNFVKSYTVYLHLRPKQYAKYHESISSAIYNVSLQPQCVSQKRGITQLNIFGISSKVVRSSTR